MKKNKLLELWKEAEKETQNETGKENPLPFVGCLKKILIEKIEYDKNKYLHYKMLVEGNSFNEPVSMILAFFGIICSIIVGELDMVLECLNLAKCYGLIVIGIAVVYIVILAIVILHYYANILKYKKIGIVLDEIYKERFEGKESNK